MSSRERVLARIMGAGLGAPAEGAEHPGAYRIAPGPADFESFSRMLQRVGGEAAGPFAEDELAEALRPLLRAWADGGRVVVSGERAERAVAPLGLERIDAGTDPHSLSSVKVAVLFAGLGVAENAAVSLDGRAAPLRALPFLCDHLVLLLELGTIVPDMHRAFIGPARDATSHHHLTFVSGPSKTADIEQALVLGAHGPRRTTVVGIA